MHIKLVSANINGEVSCPYVPFVGSNAIIVAALKPAHTPLPPSCRSGKAQIIGSSCVALSRQHKSNCTGKSRLLASDLCQGHPSKKLVRSKYTQPLLCFHAAAKIRPARVKQPLRGDSRGMARLRSRRLPLRRGSRRPRWVES